MRNSFMHSLLAKGRLLYTHDETIAALCARAAARSASATRQLQLFARGRRTRCPAIDKAHKWLRHARRSGVHARCGFSTRPTRWRASKCSARGCWLDREVIPQAMKLNPGFFSTIYTGTAQREEDARNPWRPRWRRSTDTSAERAATLFAPLIEHLREVGEARSATEIEDHFRRNFNIDGVTAACEYLADCGLIGKASTAGAA